MSKEATKKSTKELMAEFERGKVATRKEERKEEQTDTIAVSIKNNTFFKILFDPSTTAVQKSEAIKKALIFEGSKTENAKRVAEFEALKQYLQLQRQSMAQEFMKLADTKSFAELKQVIDQMNAGLVDFEERMKPLSDILEAVYELRTGGEGLILDAYKDIEADKRAEAEMQKQIADANKEMDDIHGQIRKKENSVATLSEDKPWFTLFRIRKESRIAINMAQMEIGRLNKRSADVEAKLQEIKNSGKRGSSLLPEGFENSKAALRNLLDISSEEHSERQKSLVDAARKFVSNAQERTGSVLGHLEAMDKRIENIAGANQALCGMYAIMDDASKGAASANKDKSEDLTQKKTEGEGAGMSSVEAMELSDKISALNDHITTLDRTAVDTSRTLADLSEQNGRISTMKDRNRSQIAKTRSQMTSGIAGVADRLVGVLTAVSLASLSESSELMQGSLNDMDRQTRGNTEKEVFQKVLGQKIQNDQLATALRDATEFRETLEKGTSMYRDQVQETFALVDEMSAQAAEMKEIAEEAKAAHADARREFEKAKAGQVQEASNDNDDDAPALDDQNPLTAFFPSAG